MFRRCIGSSNVESHKLVTGFRDGHAIEVGNRYFMPAIAARKANEKIISFGDEVDPEGLLRNMGGNEYVHTTENRVKYKEVEVLKDGKLG